MVLRGCRGEGGGGVHHLRFFLISIPVTPKKFGHYKNVSDRSSSYFESGRKFDSSQCQPNFKKPRSQPIIKTVSTQTTRVRNKISGLEVIKLVTCSTQLSITIIMLANTFTNLQFKTFYVCLKYQYNTIQYNTIYLFSIKHIAMFIAYTLTYINVVKTTTIFLRSI